VEDPEVLEMISNLKGRRKYEEKKSKKLGYSSLYDYFKDKISKKKEALTTKASEPKQKNESSCCCC